MAPEGASMKATGSFSPEHVQMTLKNMVFASMVMYLVRMAFDVCIAEPVVEWMLRRKEKRIKKKHDDQEQDDIAILAEREKYVEGVWRLAIYTFTTILGAHVVWTTKRECLMDPFRCYDDVLVDNRNFYEQLHYSIELGIYVNMLFDEFRKTHKKDFVVMCTHHVVTLILMVGSTYCRAYSIGCLVLLVHDAADPFLEMAKLFRRVDYFPGMVVSFLSFTVVWIVTRLWYFPLYAIMGTYNRARGQTEFPSHIPGYAMTVFLCMLFIMHLIWSYFIARLYLNFLRDRGTEDVTSPTVKRKRLPNKKSE